jgi:hypothetical protein
MGEGEDGEWAAEVVLDQLRGLRSPDDLVVLFLALLELVTEKPETQEGEVAGFDPQSALGKYLHQCNIGFAELSFEVCPVCTHSCLVVNAELAIIKLNTDRRDAD